MGGEAQLLVAYLHGFEAQSGCDMAAGDRGWDDVWCSAVVVWGYYGPRHGNGGG